MKHIYLIRHAKSDWSDPSLDDFDRGLSLRGKRDIHLMAKWMKEKKIIPDYVLSSSAKRAKRTAKGLLTEARIDKKIAYKKALYFTTPEHMIEIIKMIDDKYKEVFLFGHNPEMTELVNLLLEESIENVPTLGIVGLQSHIKSWKKFEPQNVRLDFFIYPKLFR